eukprot:1439585-Rhodomonas_salina.1
MALLDRPKRLPSSTINARFVSMVTGYEPSSNNSTRARPSSTSFRNLKPRCRAAHALARAATSRAPKQNARQASLFLQY